MNAWEGFNASLFAYGQTGSGKSYSVVGYPPNRGIVPLVCEDIFTKASTIKDKNIEVTFSMLEIYSEIVRDLLNPIGDKKKGLNIRQDAKVGFYGIFCAFYLFVSCNIPLITFLFRFLL